MSTNNNNTTRSANTSRHIIGILSIIIAICCGSVSSVWAQTLANADIIPGEYIVAFKKTEPPLTPTAIRALAESLVISSGGQLLSVYEYAAPGFAAKLSARAVSVLQQDSRVDFIEPNRVIQLDPVTASADATKLAVPVQPQSYSWGLDRIDQRNLPLDGNYTYTLNGAGVRVYIIDTGILTTHADFGGRAVNGYDPFGTTCTPNSINGHGTHVAATVGGATYGVAKGVNLIGVRVLDCNGMGSYAGVIGGVNWVTAQKQLAPGIPAVANMSLGGTASAALDSAVKDSIAKGVTYSVAAGNNGLNPNPALRDACNYSPARVETAITVGATAANDKRAGFSNIGSCVSIFAPGQDITSAWNTSNTAVASLNGTSMAAPHTAGVAALYLQNNKTATPADVKSVILGRATLDVVTDIGFNSPNLLLYSLIPNYKNYGLTYRAYTDTTSGSTWQPWVSSPSVAGTTGQSLPMKAMQASFPTTNMVLLYRARITTIGTFWPIWGDAGTIAGTTSATAPPLEAAQLIVPAPCKVRYRSHVADLGWLPWVDGPKITGTIGQSRRMEAIQMVCTCPQ